MQEPPWLPRTNEEYLQQLVADAGPQPDEFIALQAELDAAGGEIAHLTALLAERDAEIARLREALELELQDEINAILKGGSALTAAKGQAYIDQSPYVQRLRAALAARGGEADAAH